MNNFEFYKDIIKTKCQHSMCSGKNANYRNDIADTLYAIWITYRNNTKVDMLTWLYAAHEEPILDEKEKRYLGDFIAPFKQDSHNLITIEKRDGYTEYNFDCEYIVIMIYTDYDDNKLKLPIFSKGAMYKGMELDTLYKLEDLGL